MIANTISGLAVVLLLIEALVATLIIPEFKQVFAESGAALPTFTQVILASVYWVWLFPVLAIGLIAMAEAKKEESVGRVLFVFGLGILYVPLSIHGLYLPVY